MKVVSVNRGERKLVDWRGKKVETGIFKFSVEGPIFLGTEDVVKDDVVDRRYHGGVDKAAYAYSFNNYDFWKQQFPGLEFEYGIFGENLTVSGMDESQLQIGSVYQVGEAKVQVCQPRQPCFKLGIRFGTQSVVKKFLEASFPGVYFRVIEEGKVNVGDKFHLVEVGDELTISQVYRLLYDKHVDGNTLALAAMDSKVLPVSCKATIWKTQTGEDLKL